MTNEPISLSAFGREIGVSGTAIRKAIALGRIPSAALGTRELSTGRRVPVVVDVSLARAAFRGEALPSMGHRSVITAEGVPDVPPIAVSRALKEHYAGELRRLEFEQRAGKLVNAEEIKVRLVTMITTARTHMLGVPSKAKGRIPHLTIDDIAVLNQLIREALEDLSEDRT